MFDNIFISFIIILVSLICSYWLDQFVKIIIQSIKFNLTIEHYLLLICKITIWFFISFIALLFILNIYWISITGIITGVWISGLIFTIIWKDFLTNITSNVIFILNWTFKIGDHIKIGDIEWTVTKLTINYTIIETNENKIVFYPNKKLIWEPILTIKT